MNPIITRIEEKIWQSVETEKRIGALDGLSGIALFYNYLLEIEYQEEYQNKLFTIIDKIGDLISEESYNSSLCSGIAGYAWVLAKMKNKNLEIEEDYFEALDALLEESLTEEANKNYYDFLHGAFGIALYFIERYKTTKNKDIEHILVQFSNNLIDKIKNNPKDLFLSNSEKPNLKCYYFGLAHGISGILNFLIHLQTNLDKNSPDVHTAIYTIIEFMDTFKIFDEESKQYYPSQIFEDNLSVTKARLGWCQGDLGIANAILNSGLFLNNSNIQEEAVALIDSTRKIKVKESLANDFAICHGSAGIILQYYLAMAKTKVPTTDTMMIWHENLKKQTNDFSDFKSFFIDKYINETNILNGAAGLGLALLTIENKIQSDWTECLNLY
ncbi:lanthionine synthetase LanC family protein [Flavobacterium sp. KACC 22761]|uniref:lanthionine synthetase LanC family protein n=1 Tax=Flavobacterium sp. KACC 22761 TaxID=3092665 RepID=UPI002A754404|nr:lanthionine synthetase LanC family protein [Flavobacterium sp. KACC 22761]WPO79417.1 lanthionine synthetase LanC family protein [Flavobacterium sp. KACC 22761]